MSKTRYPALGLVLGFLGILAAPGLLQTVTELGRRECPQALDLFRQVPTAKKLRSFERELEEASIVARQVRPGVQSARCQLLGDAGEKAVVGLDGWLFYKPGFRYLTERPPAQSPPDQARAAITDFRDQLARRGIRLMVMPVPNKESIYPEQVTRRAAAGEILIAPQTRALMADLRQAGVEVVDLFEVYRTAKQGQGGSSSPALYLKQDSHWSPAGVELAARTVAQRILASGRISPGPVAYETRAVPVTRRGDIIRMLQAPGIEESVAPERIDCRQVRNAVTGQPYEDDAKAEILVLGDSFLRIYAQDEPTGAGFLAQLARELGQPLTSVVNDGGASTLVRQELHRKAALLRNKRLVIWEFVERDIRFGLEGWQKVALPPEKPEQPNAS